MHRCYRIAAAHDRGRAARGGRGHGLRNFQRAVRECRHLKHAHGPIPDDRFGFRDFGRERRNVSGPMSSPIQPAGVSSRRHVRACGVGPNSGATT